MTGAAKDDARVEVASRAELRRWLAEHWRQRESIWLVTFRKSAGARHVPYDAIVEESLCFGWIDSLPRALDSERTMVRLSPRKPGSVWSTLNKQRVESLLAAGLMEEGGLASIEAAKAAGSWTRLDGAGALEIPADLARALEAHPPSALHFGAFPPSTRRAILEWIATAKTEETRNRRVEQTARLAAENIRANQWRAPRSPKS